MTKIPNSQMGSSTKPLSLLFRSLSFFIISGFLVHGDNSTYNTKLVFRGCADQKFQDPSGVYSDTLKTLFDSLSSISMNKSFSSTTSGEGQSAIYGLYQCRGDLTTTDCYNCVSKLPTMAQKLCGKSVAARIQLNGCYMRYEITGFQQVPDTELLYKVCGSTKAQVINGTEFEGKRDMAFELVEKGVESGGGFYTGTYESVYVLGQCEEDLSSGNCSDCVTTALEEVKAGCGDSVSGQVYLQKCYISYTYYPNGVSSPGTEQGEKQGTMKTVAIVVGGVAALGFMVVCFLFIKSVFKKHAGKTHLGYY